METDCIHLNHMETGCIHLNHMETDSILLNHVETECIWKLTVCIHLHRVENLNHVETVYT